MKKSLFAMCAILVLSMLASSVVFAEPTHPNEVGLYMTPDGYGATGTMDVMVPVDVFLVLTKPADAENGYVPFSHVLGFELALHFDPSPIGDLFLLGEVFPPSSINVGDNSDINQGFLDYIVGVSSDDPLIVTDESVVLMMFTFMKVTASQTAVILKPIIPASISGEMAFLGEEYEQLRVMHSISGSHDAPVFIFNGEAVAVETESFGSVKALFR